MSRAEKEAYFQAITPSTGSYLEAKMQPSRAAMGLTCLSPPEMIPSPALTLSLRSNMTNHKKIAFGSLLPALIFPVISFGWFDIVGVGTFEHLWNGVIRTTSVSYAEFDNNYANLLNMDESLDDVSCADKVCLAVGSDTHFRDPVMVVYRSLDHGNSWIPASQALRDITSAQGSKKLSCAGDANCTLIADFPASNPFHLADDKAIFHTTDGGATWARSTFSSGGFFKTLSCGGKKGLNCTALGYSSDVSYLHKAVAISSHDGGASWAGPYLLPLTKTVQYFSANDVSCDKKSGLNCVVVGQYYNATDKKYVQTAFFSKDGGTVWKQATIPFTPTTNIESNFTHVACGGTDGKTCLGIGYGDRHSFLVRSADAGKTWTQINDPHLQDNSFSYKSFKKINCTLDTCLIVGSNFAFMSSDGGLTWDKPHFTDDGFKIGNMVATAS